MSPKIKRFFRIQGSPESRKRDYECSLREAQSKRCCPKGQNANKLLIVLEPHLWAPLRPAHASNFFSTLGFYIAWGPSTSNIWMGFLDPSSSMVLFRGTL